MSVVFGWYGITIKSYTAMDLGLVHEDWANSKFEIRQNVFHLFWIPFFPIGKDYFVRQKGELYGLSDSIISLMQEKGKVRTPWYSFTIPVMGVAVLLFLWLQSLAERHYHYSIEKEHYASQIAIVEADLSKLTTNYFIGLEHVDDYYSSKLYLRILKINGSMLTAQVMKDNLPFEDPTPFYFTKFIYERNPKSDTITFTKDDLQQAICRDYSRYYKRKPCGYDFMGDGSKYSIKRIVALNEPVIEGYTGSAFWTLGHDKQFSVNTSYEGRRYVPVMEFQNDGLPVDLMEIINMEGNITLIDTLPVYFKTNKSSERVRLKVSFGKSRGEVPKFKSLLVFEDSLKRRFEYLIEGSPSSYKLNRN